MSDDYAPSAAVFGLRSVVFAGSVRETTTACNQQRAHGAHVNARHNREESLAPSKLHEKRALEFGSIRRRAPLGMARIERILHRQRRFELPQHAPGDSQIDSRVGWYLRIGQRRNAPCAHVEFDVLRDVEARPQLPPSARIVAGRNDAACVATVGLTLELHALAHEAGA